MSWFNFIFLGALIVSLLGNKAYFRGVVERQKDPRQFWSIIVCYAALAGMPLLLPVIKVIITNPRINSIQYLMTDAATRAANDLKNGVAHAHGLSNGHYVIELKMRAQPEGCSEDYTLQLSRQAALVVWCKEAGTGRTTSSHITTSHLGSVDVPETLIVTKHAGQSVIVEMQQSSDKDRVIGLR